MNGQERSAGARIVRGIIVIIVGLIIWYSPVPAGVKKEAWHLLAIFVATIFGLILTPLPMGAVVIIGVMMTTFTGVTQNRPSSLWLRQQHGLADRGRLFGRPRIHQYRPGEENCLHVHPGFRPQNHRAGLFYCGQRVGSLSSHSFEHGPGRGDHLSHRPGPIQHLRV